jgi:hypothetical protein
MSSAKQSSISHDMQSSLAELRGIVGLVVFAIEARRVLQAVDTVAGSMPQVDRALSGAIEVRRQWTECPDTAAEVLGCVYERLDELAAFAADAER